MRVTTVESLALRKARINRHDSVSGIVFSFENSDFRVARSVILSSLKWCARQDLNLHALRHYHLKVARLPIPPRAHGTPYNETIFVRRRKVNLAADEQLYAIE